MSRELKPILRPSMKQEVANMNDALAQMRRSGSIYFLKSLPRSAIQKGETGTYAELTLPALFVQENCDKIEEWVILRAHLSCGRSSRPWIVRFRVAKTTLTVRIGLGWRDFVSGNRLKEGDSLIFLLKEEARSEFEVHMFRGPQGSPHFPDEGENSTTDEEEEEDSYVSDSEEDNSTQSRFHSPGHDRVELNKAIPHTKRLEKHGTFPGFRKRLTPSSIRVPNGDRNTGQFYFPWSFVKTHGNQVGGSVKLQGIHQNSPTYLVTCHHSPYHCLKVYFAPNEWSRFVTENGLKNGDELQLSLIAESYFVVRKV